MSITFVFATCEAAASNINVRQGCRESPVPSSSSGELSLFHPRRRIDVRQRSMYEESPESYNLSRWVQQQKGSPQRIPKLHDRSIKAAP